MGTSPTPEALTDEAIRTSINEYLASVYAAADIERWWRQPLLHLGRRTPQEVWDHVAGGKLGLLRLVRDLYAGSPNAIPFGNVWKKVP